MSLLAPTQTVQAHRISQEPLDPGGIFGLTIYCLAFNPENSGEDIGFKTECHFRNYISEVTVQG